MQDESLLPPTIDIINILYPSNFTISVLEEYTQEIYMYMRNGHIIVPEYHKFLTIV